MAEEQAEQAEGVPWEIRYSEGSLFDLWNITGTTKFGVQIAGGGVLRPTTVDRIDGRSSVDFFATSHLGAVTMSWSHGTTARICRTSRAHGKATSRRSRSVRRWFRWRPGLASRSRRSVVANRWPEAPLCPISAIRRCCGP